MQLYIPAGQTGGTVIDQASIEVTRSSKKFESPYLVELWKIRTQIFSWRLKNLRPGFLVTGREVAKEVTLGNIQPFSMWGADQAGRNDCAFSQVKRGGK